jgi:hypothetical protein
MDESSPEPVDILRQAMNERVIPEVPAVGINTLRHARIPASRAEEFSRRVLELADEFTELETVPGERVYGLVAGVFLTDLPELPEEE